MHLHHVVMKRRPMRAWRNLIAVPAVQLHLASSHARLEEPLLVASGWAAEAVVPCAPGGTPRQ